MINIRNKSVYFLGVVFASLCIFVLSTTTIHAAAPGDGVTSVSIGDQTTCAVRQNKAYCWGFGIGGSAASSPKLVTSSALSGKTVSKVSTGKTHACLIARAGVLLG
ncbi:MAG: hypothetical protein QG549_718 [Patescibacteria group bacterium]|nr:hypothetical protein [Patescibacteria group bacterium]